MGLRLSPLAMEPGFQVIRFGGENLTREFLGHPHFAAHNAVGLAGESPVVGVDCLPT